MRILVHGLVGTNLGGIETFLLNMNEAMSDECIFDYVIEESKCMHEARIHKKGGKIYHITSRRKNVKQHLRDLKKLYREHKEEYEVIYFNLSSASWILPQLIGKYMGYRVVIHSHNAMLIDANSNLFYKVVNCVNRFLLGHMKFTRLTCSDLASKFLFGDGKSIKIYNGINVEQYKFSSEIRFNIREKYDIAQEAFVIGVIGRLAYQKNPLFSIEIFNQILKDRPDSFLFMIGDGKLRQEVMGLTRKYHIEDHVILTGNIQNVNEYLNVFDVFMLPSRHEGLGIALIEAQANGLPCVTSKDVVPVEAKVSDRVEFVKLEKTSHEWANIILSMNQNMKREEGYYLMKNSLYNIQIESKKLENILIGKCK